MINEKLTGKQVLNNFWSAIGMEIYSLLFYKMLAKQDLADNNNIATRLSVPITALYTAM